MAKIRKGDTVQMLSGKDRGKQGEVMTVLPSAGKVIVDGFNVVKKHQKPTSATMQGGIIDKDLPVPIAAVAYVCPDCGATRVGYRIEGDGTKVRVCKKCKKDLD